MRAALLALAAWLLVLAVGCAAMRPAPEPGQDLASFLKDARVRQAFPIGALYRPPPAESYDTLFQLSETPVALDLAANATAFSAWRKGLAAGFADGQVRTWGKRACTGLAEPLPGPVDLVAWGPFSRWLVASDATREKAYVVDLDSCRVARTVDLGLKLRYAAVSDVGATAAYLDSAGRLFMGEPDEDPKPVIDLPEEVVGLGFTPGEGVLAVVEASGLTTLVDVRTRQVLDRIEVAGGPFAGVRFAGRHMALETRFGTRLAFDLALRQPVPYSRKLDQYFIDQDEAGTMLRYRTWGDVLHLSSYKDWPGLRVQRSPGLNVIRVVDVDGAMRYYSLRTGKERPCAAAMDWQEVATNAKGNFCLGPQCYILADVAFQWDHDQLLCRWIEGQGYYLWWLRTERPAQASPLPDHLPRRENIKADRPALWYPVLPPPEFP